MSFFSSLTNILKPIAKVGSFIPGPHQPFAMAASAGLGLTDHLGAAAGIGSLSHGRGLNREALNAQREGLRFARERDQMTAPLRALALRDLLAQTPDAPSLGDTFVDPTNPFSRSAAPLALSLSALNQRNS